LADTKVSAAADIATLVGTDMVPVARSGSTTAYKGTLTEVTTFVVANLPVASTGTAGVVKVDGTTITITSGTIAASAAPYTSAPTMNGTAAPGISAQYSRGDHVHPTDASLAPKASPTLTGTVTATGPLVLTGIPTSKTGLPTGSVWNNAGTLSIV